MRGDDFAARVRRLKGRAENLETMALMTKMQLAPVIYSDAMALMSEMVQRIETLEDDANG